MIKPLAIKSSIIFNIFYIFFGYTIGSQRPFLLFIMMISLVSLFLTGKIKILTNNILFFLFAIFVSLSVLYSTNMNSSFNYTITIWSLFVIQLFLGKTNEYKDFIMKVLVMFSSIHVIFTLLNTVIPELVANISRLLLSGEDFVLTQYMLSLGSNSGITNQTGTNAIYISVFIGLIATKLLAKHFSIKNLILLLLGVIALLLTNKRGMLLATALGVIFTFLIQKKITLKKRRTRIMLFLTLGGIVLFLFNSTVLDNFLEYSTRKSVDDITNGRLPLWENTMAYFYNSPFFGNGIYTMYSELDSGTHNVYLQLLAETGLFGSTLFISYLLYNLRKIIVMVRNIPMYELQFSLYFQIVFIVYCFTGNPIYNSSFFLMYILIVSMPYSKLREDLSIALEPNHNLFENKIRVV